MGKYRVLGSFLDRVFRNNLNANFDDVDADIQAQKKRVDDLIIANPSPSEVQDARGGFTVLRDRLNKTDEQLAEKALISDLGKVSDFKGVGTSLTEKVKNEFEGRGINPESFGLSSEATDNHQSVVDTINYVKAFGGGRIIFSHGKKFKFTQPLKAFEATNITIDLNGSTLDFSNTSPSTTDSLLQFNGTSGVPVAITSNAIEGSKIILCDTSGLKVGDMVKVYSNKIWDSTRTNTRIGEMAFIEKIDSASQLTLTTPLNDTYNVSDVANIVLITPCENIVIMNGSIIGPTGDNEVRGIRLNRALDCTLKGLDIKGCDVNQVQVLDGVRVTVTECFFQEANDDSMAYGVSFADASQDCIVSNCHFTDVRHSLSTNNNVTTSWGIARRILFTDNTITDSSPAIGGTGGDAIDTHAGAEEVFIINNNVFSSSGLGINIEARSAVVRGNRIKGTGSIGIYFNPYADGKPSRVLIADNVITHVGDAVGSDYGIQVMARMFDMLETVLVNNIVESQNGSIRVLVSGINRHQKAVIQGNALLTKESGFGIDLVNADYAAVQGNTMEVPNYGISLTNVRHSTITGNAIKINSMGANMRHGIRVFSTSKRNIIANNVVNNVGTVTGTSYGIKLENEAYSNGIFGNTSENLTATVDVGTGVGNTQANNF